ncbi:aldehyde dehydrogenase family protein [Rhodococcoides fascians]|uniref:aldehyde dehydrogenase family protein n=1 Tax=Rhodococcoides fascians TaxID=1828 RepID=UPI000561F393|nr:aldehyde dehydrogenase family protein [Rhodococcus fascians]
MTSPIALRNFVAGAWTPGHGPAFASTSPHDPSTVVGQGTSSTVEDVDAAVAAAAAATQSWRRTPMHERAAYLSRAATVVESNAEQWARELTIEEGKPIGEARGEIGRAAEILRYVAGQANNSVGQVFASPRAGERIVVDRRPVGVVAVVSPFNFPIAIPAWKIAPALVHGNTVVWKPPTSVSVLATRLTEAFAEAGLPDGVLSLVHGEGDTGAWLVEHAGVDAVTFTGSTSVGRRIAGSCAAKGIAVQAEMGGKNAAIVLPDADLDNAVSHVVSGAFRSAGQKCTATSRLVLHEKIADRFLSMLADAVRELVVGDPLEPNTFVGPLVSARSRDNVTEAIESASADGATVVVRGELDDALEGHYVAPTVMEVTGNDAGIWREELFGPVLAVRRVHDVAEAVEAASVGEYGLCASVFTTDLEATTYVSAELNVGMVHVNSETAGADPHVPFGGNKASSYGPREQGTASREFFTTTTTTYVRV